MNELEFKELASNLSCGKRLPGATYVHRSLFETLPDALSDLIHRITRAIQIPNENWNIVKVHTDDFKLSFLHYPTFDEETYPALSASKVVDLKRKSVRDLSFESDPNPPILHRKELMVPQDYPQREDFLNATLEGEAAGLYTDTRRIGFKRDWQRLVRDRGYVLVDGRLFRAATFASSNDELEVFRERTAISRTQLSVPMRALSHQGLLEGQHSICDYGCGRGDDLEILTSMGLDAVGWDPNFYPEGDRLPSDIVNLGYVINVIEDKAERDEALQKAWDLAQKLLVVSAMIASDTYIERFRPYKDGVITTRNTFQKYFAQEELKNYIESVLGVAAQAVSPGVFFVFDNELLEAEFAFSRMRRRRSLQRAPIYRKTHAEKVAEIVDANREIFDAYWTSALELGRWPTADEFSEATRLVGAIGSLRKAQSAMLSVYDEKQFAEAEQERRADLVLSQAMSFFRGREPFSQMPPRIRFDIRHFYRTYRDLQSDARNLLKGLTNTESIENSCVAHFGQSSGHGHLEARKAYTLNVVGIQDLPVDLRAYIACAEQLAGSASLFHLVKIHFHTGKVSFMKYEGFLEAPIPMLIERVKVDLWNQRISYYDYVDEYRPKPLYWKSKFILKEDPTYSKQSSFDKRLDDLGLAPENPHFGFSIEETLEILRHKGLEIRGHRFHKVKSD